jgi:hypothetical protein
VLQIAIVPQLLPHALRTAPHAGSLGGVRGRGAAQQLVGGGTC